jgi:hypothetical protein
VPGEAEREPPGLHQDVLLHAIGAEAVDVDVPGPAVHLDGDLGLGERDVDVAARPERQVKDPAVDAGVAQDCDEGPLGERVGAVGGRDQEGTPPQQFTARAKARWTSTKSTYFCDRERMITMSAG